MTSNTGQPQESKQAKQSFLSKLRHWVGTNKSGLLVNIVASAIWSPVLPLLILLWKAIVAATTPHTGLLESLTTELKVSAWILPSLFLLPFVLLYLFWYVRLYRYRADTFFGLDFTWMYSFPMGRIVRVRAFCPVCRKAAPEPVHIFERADNYLCRNCHHNTDIKHPPRMEYPWHEYVRKKVREKRQAELRNP